MNRARLLVSMLLVSLLSGLLGCDVAVVAVLMSRKSGSSKTPAAAPGPNLSFNLWVAELGGIAGATEQGTIDANNGDPDPIKWTLLASATTSGEYTMPPPTAGGFDSILIQATVNQIYEVDSIEIIDSTGTTIQTADASTTFCNSEITPLLLTDAQGPPDGKGTLTTATSTKRSFIFMKRATPITTFRVNLWQQNGVRISGDAQWTRTYVLPGSNQVVGGADINSLGTVYISFRDGSGNYMIRYSTDGNVVRDDTPSDFTLLDSAVSATAGSSSIAINKSTDDVFVATTNGAGDINLQMYQGISHTHVWGNAILQGTGADRVEANGLALNSAGELIVAGGIDGGAAGGGVNHFLRKCRSDTGSDMWASASLTPPAVPPDPGDTYWYAVATGGTQDIFVSGNLGPLVLGTPDAYTSRILDTNTRSSNGSVTETWNSHSQGSGAAPTRGQSIGIDGNNNVYVAGVTTGNGLDSFIIKYSGGNSTPGPHFKSTRAGDDEFLDIAVDTDGTIYATGYETNSTQEDLVLFKLAPNGAVDWKRTLNFNNNADRGNQVMLTATHVIVVGQVTNTGGDLDIHVRKYVK